MSNINGLDNEFEFVRYLNGKKVKELNPLMREVIDDIFNNIDDDSIVKCWRNHFKQKSDIFIKINKVMKGISIKKGMKNSVHVEGISNFVDFLKENKVDDKIINEYLKYHFADDTIDGSGEIRYGVDEYKRKNQKNIVFYCFIIYINTTQKSICCILHSFFAKIYRKWKKAQIFKPA